MQIVINIDDNVYKRALVYKGVQLASNSANDLSELITAVANGTPLPKGHGRLIDAEQLMNYCQNQIDGHKYADCNVIARFPIVLDAEVKNEDSN